MKKYFHELTEGEFNNLIKGHESEPCTKFAEEYPQPKWCEYPDAVSPLGCWSLTGFMVTGEEYCKKCECYKEASSCEK